jgi:hypothetical protein
MKEKRIKTVKRESFLPGSQATACVWMGWTRKMIEERKAISSLYLSLVSNKKIRPDARR